jgi:branched-chain amino acid transport system ATP-binding protein
MPLKLDGLCVRYGPIRAASDITLEVPPGEVVSVIGPNGAGKTSLLRGVVGLVQHTGRIEVDGVDIARLPAHRRTRAGLGFVPDGEGVFRGLTVYEHIRVAAGRDHGEAWERLTDAFPLLATKQNAKGAELSGGQQRVVSIARALASRPKYIVLDEPSMGLSPIAIQGVVESIQALSRHGVGILLAEQNAALALRISKVCHVLVRGEIRLTGTPDELRDRSEVEALYLGRALT